MEVVKPTSLNKCIENDINNCPSLSSKKLMYLTYTSRNQKDQHCTTLEMFQYGKEQKSIRLTRNSSRFLLAWGCGEFGQHGHDHIDDVTLDKALNQLNSGTLLLDGDAPTITVSGSSHTLVLSDNGHLYSWGNGTSGQLGNGASETVRKPTRVIVETVTQIQGMACGARHSFIWTVDGQCYSFGNNFSAQLGYNFTKVDFKENQLQPVLVELFPHMKVKEVACGARHTLFLLTTGHVMAVGCNQHGQIGNDLTEDVVIPTKLEDLSDISHVACGNSHSLASDDTGKLYAWGYGKAFGTKTRHVVSPQLFNPNRKGRYCAVIGLAGGDSHSMALYQNGILYTWGNNYEGQLGLGKCTKFESDPTPISSSVLPRPVVQISCGETTCAAVTGKGELFMWGKNAGLIHSEKPSQYFQFQPYRIETGDMLVTQVSCGAWHVSAIVGDSKTLQNHESRMVETYTTQAEGRLIQLNAPNCEVADCSATRPSFTVEERENTTLLAFTNSSKSQIKDHSVDEDNGPRAICNISYDSTLGANSSQTHCTNSIQKPSIKSNEKTETNINGYYDKNTKTSGVTDCENKKSDDYCEDYFNTTDNESISQNSEKSKMDEKPAQIIEQERTNGSVPNTWKQQHNLHLKTTCNHQNRNETSQNDLTEDKQGLSDCSDGFNSKEELSDVLDNYSFHSGVRITGKWQHTRALRQHTTSSAYKVVESRPLFSRQHTMPVVNLSFRNTLEKNRVSKGQDELKKRKPGFFSLRNMWNTTKLLHEKQSKKVLVNTQENAPVVDSLLNLESVLPNRPKHSRGVNEITKWTKFRQNTSLDTKRTKQASRHICYSQTGEILPPICSCRRTKMLSSEEQTLPNVFIEKR